VVALAVVVVGEEEEVGEEEGSKGAGLVDFLYDELGCLTRVVVERWRSMIGLGLLWEDGLWGDVELAGEPGL
jgi:hypothetical protein